MFLRVLHHIAWQDHQEIYAMLRHVVDECAINSGWRWLDSVDQCLQGKGVKFVALVTAEQQSQEAAMLKQKTIFEAWLKQKTILI